MSYKINSYQKIDKNLKSLIDILTENKINYWICHGTLLGIIRDNQLIPWDHDIDIGVIENKINRIIFPLIMKRKGFKEIKKTFLEDDGMMKFVRKGGREVDINFYKINKKNKTVYVKWYVPKNLLMKIIDALSFASSYKGEGFKFVNTLSIFEKLFLRLKKILVQNHLFYSFAGYSHNFKYASNLKKYNFFNLKIFIPKDSHAYLRDLYGDKWRIPKKKYNWVKHSPSTITFNKK
jgi:hypothetical protein